MTHEQCESETANPLASFDNLPDDDVNGKLRLLLKILEVQGKTIQDMQRKLDGHGDLPASQAHAHEMSKEELEHELEIQKAICDSCGEE